MLELILDKECHNGHHARQPGAWHWQLEARGDNAHYCYYFHFTLRASEAGEAVVDVAPDGDLPEGRDSFRRHRPEAVWLSRGSGWERHPVAPDGPPDCIRLRAPLEAGAAVSLSRMRPAPYSGVRERLAALAGMPGARPFSLGRSAEGREVPGLEIGTGPARLLVLAGQHPAEFGGTEAVLGIAEWLLSRAPEAGEVRARFTTSVAPVLNPDGNVQGRTGCNARGEDLYRAFSEASGGARPAAPEAALLWDWIAERRPVLSLNFHTYTQPSPTGDFPWEGLYTAPDEAFPDESARERQRRLDDLLAWETDGLSQSGRFSLHVPGALEYQLAALGVLNAFYEVQDVVGLFRQRRTGVRVLRTALRARESG
jgi:hypothetical protein